MDSLHDKLFSRATGTPPPPSSFSINQQTQPTSSTSSPSPATHLDSLFQSIATQQNTTAPHGNSAPPTPSMIADDATSTHSAPVSTTPADRQSALLSLLYPAATSAPTTRPLQAPAGPLISQQVQTPPAQSSRSGQSPSNISESPGKILLEQLMGCVSFIFQIHFYFRARTCPSSPARVGSSNNSLYCSVVMASSCSSHHLTSSTRHFDLPFLPNLSFLTSSFLCHVPS
jgi:hypothetical protein